MSTADVAAKWEGHIRLSIGVIGSGAWDTTLAILLANQGTSTALWEHRPECAAEIGQQRENTLFLPGFHFSFNITRISAILRKGA